MFVGEEHRITVSGVNEAGEGALTCKIVGPSENSKLFEMWPAEDAQEEEGVFCISHIPADKGDYSFRILFGGEVIPDGEFIIKVLSTRTHRLPIKPHSYLMQIL